MRKIIFLLSLTLIFSFCQNEKPKKETPVLKDTLTFNDPSLVSPTDPFIKKYEGKIDNQHPIELVLINWSSGLLGGYYYHIKDGKPTKKIELSGELQLNETFVLDEFTNDEFSGKFKASLSELTKISGIWLNADSTQSFPFLLHEISSKDNTGWSGAWYRNSAYSMGMLILGNVTDKTVDFGLEVFNGGHSGVLEGTANLNGGIATFKNSIFGEEEECNLVFQKHNNQIRIDQKSNNWACGFGMRAHAEGKYDSQLAPEKLELAFGEKFSVFPNKKMRDDFKSFVGNVDYESYAFNFQTISKIPKNDEDKFEANVFIGSVVGLATTNEAIIMRNEKGDFWSATIIYDPMIDNFKIKYHTNVEKYKEKTPITIKQWMDGFPEFELLL